MSPAVRTVLTVMTATIAEHEWALLAAAQAGDERAYERLIEPRRRELHAHCYRILGSVHHTT